MKETNHFIKIYNIYNFWAVMPWSDWIFTTFGENIDNGRVSLKNSFYQNCIGGKTANTPSDTL